MNFNESTPIMKFCGNCGKKLLENATFCAYCGAPISKVGDVTPHQGEIPHIMTRSMKISPQRPFLANFRGALLTPKEEMPQIVSSPNFSQAFLLNLLIGILAAIALWIFYNKFEIFFSDSFINLIPLDVGDEEITLSELKNLYKVLLPISALISIIINWLILSLILWILHVIFASDLDSNMRNYKTMATMVGWAQIPLIIHQFITIIIFILSPGGQVIFNSIWERVIINGVPFADFFLVIDIMAILWSAVLLYYAIKSLGSVKANPLFICVIYGILYYFLFPIVV